VLVTLAVLVVALGNLPAVLAKSKEAGDAGTAGRKGVWHLALRWRDLYVCQLGAAWGPARGKIGAGIRMAFLDPSMDRWILLDELELSCLFRGESESASCVKYELCTWCALALVLPICM